jgi:hypothetical protein
MPKCPLLTTIGQHDYIAVENAIDVHIDNPTQEFVFDELRQNSTRSNAFAASVEDACDCAGA